MTRIIPRHPGQILLEEFLEPSGITPIAFAERVKVGVATIRRIINGERSITVNTAMRFAKALGTAPELWLDMQQSYDLATAQKIPRIYPYKIKH